jgi:hypothetical protein
MSQRTNTGVEESRSKALDGRLFVPTPIGMIDPVRRKQVYRSLAPHQIGDVHAAAPRRAQSCTGHGEWVPGPHTETARQ